MVIDKDGGPSYGPLEEILPDTNRGGIVLRSEFSRVFLSVNDLDKIFSEVSPFYELGKIWR